MSDDTTMMERSAFGALDKDGRPVFEWDLTHDSRNDLVKLVVPPQNVLPVIFVPGIMGSNLKIKGKSDKVWRLDATFGEPLGLARGMALKNPGRRQLLLHPDRVEVDDGGDVPSVLHGSVHSKAEYKARGWGEVGETSYGKFLCWLEDTLNPTERNPALWTDYYLDEAALSAPTKPGEAPKLLKQVKMGVRGQPFHAEKPFDPLLSDDVLARSKFFMPVHACGYNWLASNREAAKELQRRIEGVLKRYNQGGVSCEQVILVTHSMGGLVARACAAVAGMSDKIAGIVHGVMPAVGAAVAYRRCKIGMRDESYLAGLVIGSDGPAVTAVFAQAPGALQLLPSKLYQPEWMRIVDDKGAVLQARPATADPDPYKSIYLEQSKWWGLVKEAWLAPKGGKAINWDRFERNISAAESFHNDLGKTYHPNSFVYYGADAKQRSFEKVTWTMRHGIAPDHAAPPTPTAVLGMTHDEVKLEGRTPEYVGGQVEYRSSTGTDDGEGAGSAYRSSYWELHCAKQDGAGDGTVPLSSGAAPLAHAPAAVKQQFKLTGFEHEPSYKDETAQLAVLYAITKIAGTAKQPA